MPPWYSSNLHSDIIRSLWLKLRPTGFKMKNDYPLLYNKRRLSHRYPFPKRIWVEEDMIFVDLGELGKASEICSRYCTFSLADPNYEEKIKAYVNISL